MSISGVIAEFNPLHLGHQHILNHAKQNDNTVICAISGNFVQRGDTAVISKFKRAEAALRCGADIVCEIPVLWSMSTAQNFALGAVSQLINLGCDEIVFGSECGNIDEIIKASEVLNHNDFSSVLSEELANGITFAVARENAAKRIGYLGTAFSTPNDTLGIEYITAARHLGFKGTFRCVKRIGAEHDSEIVNPNGVSASLIREKLRMGDIGFAERFMPANLRGFLNKDMLSDISKIENAILTVLRLRTKEELSCLPDLSEGLENKLFFSIRVATSLDELCTMIKTKRYSYARIRRLVLSAFLGFDNEFFKEIPPYTRVLGFSEMGQKHLGTVIEGDIPIVTRASEIKLLDEKSIKVFEAECRATDLFSLSLSTPQECGAEYKAKFLKTECLK